MKAPNVWQIDFLIKHCNGGEMLCGILPDGRWVPARPVGFYSIRTRINAAWLVFTGRADAVTWPGQ